MLSFDKKKSFMQSENDYFEANAKRYNKACSKTLIIQFSHVKQTHQYQKAP